MGLQAEGLISGGIISGIKNVSKRATVVLIEIVLKLKSQNKATFNPVQYCRPAQGGLYLGELITGCIFLFPVEWACNQGGL